MKTCDDCIHNGICFYQSNTPNITKCPHFKDKSRYIELPCKVGDKLYYIPFGKTIDECIVHAVEYEEKTTIVKCHMWSKECEGLLHKHLVYFNIDDFGKMVFLAKKEAEKALKERGDK